MNVFTFTGRVGSDAEIRATKTGTQVCQFSVAVDSGYGERKKTNWVRCTMFGNRGEAVAPYILKGGMISVSGELSLNEYESKGAIKSSLEVVVREVTLCGDGGKRQDKPAQEAQPVQPDFEDDDIPF